MSCIQQFVEQGIWNGIRKEVPTHVTAQINGIVYRSLFSERKLVLRVSFRVLLIHYQIIMPVK